MKTLKISFFLILGLLITLSSCEKDEPDTPTQPPVETAYNFEIGAAKTASFFGTIVDENNQTLSGVAISVGSSSAITDANGIFFIEDASVNQNLAYVKAEKSGFFLGSRSVVPTNDVSTIKIMLLAKENIGNFDASTGGTVSGNQLSIDFKAGVVDASGNPYTGLVNVAAKYIDPESDDFFDYMPGNLIGANSDGGQYLKSLGMAAIELTDASGNELQPADGSDAEVSFPLSAAMQSGAPSTIPMWHFDEAKGYWILEGEATLDGSSYKAAVSHFSFWNCDIPTDYVILSGQLVEDSIAIPNIQVRVTSTSFGAGTAFTDASGNFSGIVPANDALTLEVYFDCGSGLVSIHSQSLGSLTANTNTGSIHISTAGTAITVTGTVVDCATNPVNNGYIIYDGYKTAYLTGGNFSVLACAVTSMDIQGFDIDNLTESGVTTYTLAGSNINVGQIVACNSLTEYILWDVNGTDYLATGGFSWYSQGGSYAGFNGNTPNNISVNLDAFSGVGSYVIDNLGGNYINGTGMDSLSAANVTLNITQYGANSGDLIEGNLSGTVDMLPSGTVPVSGSIHFFRN